MELQSVKKSLSILSTNIITTVILSLLLFTNSCVPALNQSPKISSLKADSLYLYPMQNTEIRCTASSPQGDSLIYKWSSTEGTFTGSGPEVKWNAPNNYGKFHIMVVVEDNKGRSTKDTVTVEVIANVTDQQGCSTCNKR